MITVIAKLQANAGKENELRAAMEEMIANVRRHEAGQTVAYSLHVSDSDPTLFLFYEQYSSPEAVAAHGQTDHMKAFGGKIRELLAGRPTIERYTFIAGL